MRGCLWFYCAFFRLPLALGGLGGSRMTRRIPGQNFASNHDELFNHEVNRQTRQT
jgi:hypothetical protein